MINFLYYHLIPMVLMPLGFLLAWKWWNKVGKKALIFFWVFRFLFMAFAVVYAGVGVPADSKGWAMHGDWIAQGGYMPGIDFLTPYNIGFNGLLACCSLVRQGSIWPLSVVFSITGFFGCCLIYKVLAKVFDIETAKKTLILFLFSPVSYYAAEGMQDEWMQFFFLSLILFMMVQNSGCWQGVWGGGMSLPKHLVQCIFCQFFC